jgi:hypothetical protein
MSVHSPGFLRIARQWRKQGLGNFMITYFFRFFEQLVHDGHVYVLETPVFRVRGVGQSAPPVSICPPALRRCLRDLKFETGATPVLRRAKSARKNSRHSSARKWCWRTATAWNTRRAPSPGNER